MLLRDTFYRTCIVIATLVGAYLIYRLAELIIVLFVAIIFASTVRPILETAVKYRIPRNLALVLIYTGSTLAIVGLLIIAIPPVITLGMELVQGEGLVGQLNRSIIDLGVRLQRQFQIYVPLSLLPARLRELLSTADETVRQQALPVAQTTGYVIGQIVLALVMSVYWLIARRQTLSLLLRASPRRYRETVSHIWLDAEDTLGSYVRGQVILALVVGGAAYAGLLLFRVPNALALAVLAGLFEFIPFIGPVLAAVPAVILALAESPTIAILVVVWYSLIQQLEGNYLIPKIMGDNLGLHPLVVLIAFFAGYQLNGIVGALLAIPIAGVLQVIIHHLRMMPVEDEPESSGETTTGSSGEETIPTPEGLAPSPGR